MIRYTKLNDDGSDLPVEAGGHKAVRVDHPLLKQPMIWTAERSLKSLTWKEAKKWAEGLDINGWSWRLPTVEEAFLLCDRSRTTTPAIPVEYFPDCDGDWIWTGTEDLVPPAGGAWGVGLSYGGSIRYYQAGTARVRAVRSGQF